MARPRVTPLQHEILYVQGVGLAATANAVPLVNSTGNGLDVVIAGGSSSGTQYAELVTTSPGTGTLALGRYKASAPTLTDGQLYGLQLDASGNLKVSGSLSVGGTTDEAAWTAGSSSFNPSGGVFNDSAAALTSGQQGTQRLTTNRALHVNLRTAGGVELGTSASPINDNLAQVAGGTVSTTGVTGQLKVGIADSLGNAVSAFPATFLRTTDEPHQVFYDPFDSTLDVTNRWTSTQGSSGVAASNTTGVMSLGTGTVANGYSKLTSQASFTLPIPAWFGVSDAITIPDLAAPTANAYRFWGVGTTPGTPTATAPLTDAVGFELTTAGKMIAVVWAGGTRTAVQDLSAATGNSTQPTDANPHRYIVYIRTDKAYWYIDGLTSAQLVATSNFQSPQVQTLPKLFLAVGGATPPGSNSQIMSTGATAWDTGKNAVQLADGTFPWRKATISAAGALSTTTVLTAGSAVIGHVITDTGSTTAVTGTVAVSMATQTPTLQAGSTTAVTQATAANLNATAVLAAGSALVGKVGIDQTTLGSTNNVSISASTGAGTSTLIKDDTSFGDGVTTGVMSVTGRLYNGSTYDRMRAGVATGSLLAQSVQQDTIGGATALTITLASLASSAAGVGRQSTLVTSNTARSALIGIKITTGTTPTANTLVYVYLIRSDGTIADDGAGATDAAITVINAPLLGTILVSAATTAAPYTALFDTKFIGSLGPSWGIAIVNSTGAALNATAGNFTVEYRNLT